MLRGRNAKAAPKGKNGVDRKQRGQGQYKGWDTSKDSPARSGLDRHFRSAAERVRVECLRERVKRRKGAWIRLLYPHISAELPRTENRRRSGKGDL